MTRIIGDIAIAIGSSLTLSLIIKATIVSGGALIAAAIARRSRAAVRHLLLATAFLVLLGLPLVSLAVPPWDVKVPIQQPDATVGGGALAAEDAVVGASRLAESSPLQTEFAGNATPSRLTLVLAAWLAGVIYFLAVMSIGLMRTRRARRDGIPWRDGQAIAAEIATTLAVRRRIQLLLNEVVAGPITCGVVSPAIVLPPDARDWNPQDLRRAIVHELEHVRRCDWFMLCIARVVCALYWFHPLVWISLRQLRLDAERACDDAVLRCADAEAYADQLVTLAQRAVAARTYAFLAMANRSELAARVSAVLDERQPRGAAGSRWIAASAGAALFVLVGIVPLRAVVAVREVSWQSNVAAADTTKTSEAASTLSVPRAPAAARRVPATPRMVSAPPQQAVAVTGPAPRFEVVSIRANKSGDVNRRITMGSPDRFTATNITVRLLIEDAYRHSSGRLRREDEIIGGPDWIESEGYDVNAKASIPVPPGEMQQMVQSLLVDRFRLKIHTEKRDLPAYVLVRARADGQLGPQLQPSTGECRPFAGRGAAPQPDGAGPAARLCGFAGRGGPGRINGVAVTMAQVARVLANQVGGEVVDQTELPGIFDLTLLFMPQRRLPATLSEPPLDAPSIFTAVQEQMGVKLESRRVPMDVLIIDSVERPTEN